MLTTNIKSWQRWNKKKILYKSKKRKGNYYYNIHPGVIITKLYTYVADAINQYQKAGGRMKWTQRHDVSEWNVGKVEEEKNGITINKLCVKSETT